MIRRFSFSAVLQIEHNMALASVCGFDLKTGNSRLQHGFGEKHSDPDVQDAILAAEGFTVPRGIDVSLRFFDEINSFALSLLQTCLLHFHNFSIIDSF